MFFNGRNDAIKFVDGYGSMILDAKILSLKQMFQRLQMALAQVQAGITSGNLLNEISQIIYSCIK